MEFLPGGTNISIMGMFDNISVAHVLPYNEEMKELGLDINKYTFQTKDLECGMDSYVIQNSKLYIRKYKEEKWIAGDPKAKSVMCRIGHMERENPYYEEVYHHGEIYFYEFVNDVKDKWDCWIEYKATFTKGDLMDIELFKFEKTDNGERKLREKQWQEKLNQERYLWYNKYFFHTSAYIWFSRKWYKACTKIAGFFNNIAFKL